MQYLPNFKYDFEFRRVIFGLTSVVNTPPQNLPGIVAERLPDLVKSIAMISLKMREKRLEILKDNEDYVKEELKKQAQDGDFEDEDDGDDDADGEEDMDDEDSDEAEKQFRKDLKKIQNLKKKQ